MSQGYNVAIYCRLSKEDGNEESQSIQAQKEILTKYVNEQGWNIVDIYADDGYSGTNFDRPSFQKLINDIKYGKVNLVITKDLSRLGRNYIQTGYYTEEFFPENNVRYIALNDNYDTFKEENDFAPFKNIINEWYAKDISKKIRFTLDNKAKSGEPRNTVFPIFGYKYNENYERIPDPETAPIVKMIFELYLKYASTGKVAKILKEKKIKLPCYYNAIKYNYNKDKILLFSEEKLIDWKTDNVRDILKKEEYIGTYVTARSKAKSFKLKKRDKHNKDAYYFKNRYEPLISEEVYDKVQSLLKVGKSAQVSLEINVFKNMVICGCCGKLTRIQRWRNKKGELQQFRYYCFRQECKNKANIYLPTLNTIVKNELIELQKIVLSKENEFVKFAEGFDTKGRIISGNTKNELERYTKRVNELDLILGKLLEQNVAGIIPESTYKTLMDKYLKERNLIEKNIIVMTKDEINSNDEKQYKNNSIELIDKLKKISFENLDSSIVHEFIESINVKKIEGTKRDIEVTIYFKKIDPIIKEFIKNENNSSNIR